jgi:DNA-binding LacI/PurR family transcriptional regulator
MDHLAGLGHRRIAFVNGSLEEDGIAGFGPYVRSEQAYRELAVERGTEPVVLYCRPSVRSGRDTARELLATAPATTAVIIADEAGAAGLVAELKARGRSVPGHISVLSLLSSAEAGEMCDPPLTTVTTPGTELGRLAVESLLRQLDSMPPLAPALRTGVLALGGSTAPVRLGSAKPRPRKRARAAPLKS